MIRTILTFAAAAWLAAPAFAADVLAPTAVQQSVAQLSMQVTAIRSAIAGSADPRAAVAAQLPALRDRARAVAAKAADYDKQLKAMQAAADTKVLKAEADYAVKLVEGINVPIVGEPGKVITATNEQLNELSRVIERIQTELQRLTTDVAKARDPMQAACTSACVLPNATASCVNGQCAIAICQGGFADADGKAANGCEAKNHKAQ